MSEWVSEWVGSYGVPRTTLKDRVAGRVFHGSNFGPQP